MHMSPRPSAVDFIRLSIEKLKLNQELEESSTGHKTSRKKLFTEESKTTELKETLIVEDTCTSFEKIPTCTASDQDSEDKFTAAKQLFNVPLFLEQTDEKISEGDFGELFTMFKSQIISVDKLAFLIMKCPSLNMAIKQILLKEMESSLQTKYKKNNSSLYFHNVE
ncbi:hypothetical protein SNE40_002940 [Patella caerulea]|uniref:Uncharacterized protein n=1 Tax=Patella caerulea TaxID=87958 RepID=A0AAN8K9J6_PATCE